MTTLTIAEVVAEVTKATRPSDDGYATRAEIQAAMGLSTPIVCARLKMLQAAGRLAVRKVYRPALDGRVLPIVAYKVVRKT